VAGAAAPELIWMIETFELTRKTTSGTDVIDLTDDLAEQVARSGVRQGQVLVFTPGSTAAITTIEYEAGVIRDLQQAIERMAPRDMHYDHDARWGDGNGYSHVRSALVGGSFTVPVVDGRLVLGTWQQVVLLDFDNHGRTRRVVVQVSGEAA
jgi:secondary thiamine-phosphate synthase enzyme